MREASSQKSQREPDSMYRMWQFVNTLTDNVNKSNQTVNQLNKDIQKLDDRNKLGFELFPFKIYVLPDIIRGSNLDNTSWSTVRVRGGFVFTSIVGSASYVNGTDMFQQYAYQNTYPLSSSYDIALGSGAFNWFWVEKNQTIAGPAPEHSYYLRYGSNPQSASLGNPTPWATFPTANANYIPIGWVDTQSSASINQALIRQFVTNDIVLQGGSSTAWKEWSLSSSYAPNDLVKVNPRGSTFGLTWVTYPQTGSNPGLVPGLFQCMVAVQGSGSLTGSAVGKSADGHNWIYPIYPTPPSSSQVVISGSTANAVIWYPLDPYYPIQACDSLGNFTNAWAAGDFSSSFNNAQLAYQP